MVAMTINTIWTITLVLTAILFLVCHVAPKVMVRIQAMPWSFILSWNTKIEFQSILYIAFHRRWLSRLSHISFPIEQFAWFAIFFSWHPVIPIVVLGLLTIQAFMLEEKIFSWIVVATWCLICGLSYLAFTSLASTSWFLLSAKVILLLGGLIRMLGHAKDPLPPMIQETSDKFIPNEEMKINLALFHTAIWGYVSEFASSLPFRLFLVQLNWVSQLLGFQPRHTKNWEECGEMADQIHEKGWRAYPETARLFQFLWERPKHETS